MAEEAGYDISFNRFFKTGFPIMILTVTLATAYCVVRYAIEWSNDIIPMAIIAAMMLASVSLTPMIYGPAPNSPPDFELE